MVSFVSLFLGLVAGFQTVAVQVTEPVAWVEIHLDGRQVTSLEAPAWRGQIDLGAELQPHEMTAVAFAENGEELDRTSQWINLPRQPAEATILLASDENNRRRIANVTWNSLTGEEPSAVQVEFDGRPLEFDDPRAIPLPPFDPKALHFLRVELEFAGSLRSSAEITFGGTYADQVNTELTAIPVEPVGRKKLPARAQLESGFLARDRPLRLAAIEKGPVELIVVRDQTAWTPLRSVRRRALSTPLATTALQQRQMGTGDRWLRSTGSGWEVWAFQFLWPVPRRQDTEAGPYDLFSHSAKYSAKGGSLHGWLTTVEQPAEWSGLQRLADAVGVAAVTVAGGNRRRGVLLVLGKPSQDASEASPATIRRYLKSLAVPLFVWKVDPGADESWGPAVDVSTPTLMSRASQELFRALEAQRIVWLEGRHLPHQITVAPAIQTRVKTSG